MIRRFMVLLWLLLIPGMGFAQTYTASCPGALPSRLVIGQQAVVEAAGGSNLRDRPSTLALLVTTIVSGERIDIIGGPFCAEGYAWWEIEHSGIRGWLAESGSEIYWVAPLIVQAAQINTIRVETLPELGTGLQGERSEFYTAFTLTEYPIAAQYHPARLYVYMPPPQGSEIDRTLSAIQNQNPGLLEIATLAQPAFLTLQQGTGIRFLSVFFDPAERTRPAYLLYSFRGWVDSGAFVTLNLAVNPPPDRIDLTQTDENLAQFEQGIVASLNSIDPDAFDPPLRLLDAFVQSLNTQADPVNSDQVLYQYGESFTFRYHPMLAWQIRDAMIEGAPAHLAFDFDGYPLAETAQISLYRTADLSGDDLVGLQLLLGRQRSNPPHIPLPITPDRVVLDPQQVAYLTFAEGTGIRYLTATESGSTRYEFQGLSADQRYFLLATFPVTLADEQTTPLVWLDALLASIQITAP